MPLVLGVLLFVLIYLWFKAPWLLAVLAVLFLIFITFVVLRAKERSGAEKLDEETRKEEEKRLEERRKEEEQEVAQNMEDRMHELLEAHARTLVKKYRQTVYKDDYKKLVFDRWVVERNYFIERVLMTECKGILEVLDRGYVEETIDTNISTRRNETLSIQLIEMDNITPQEFEHLCANLLNDAGWEARVTKASGDQGIDIVARFGEVCAVIQCKKYAQPVGNAAVQEVIAGKAFENATVAAVVSNASFTPAARQLAAASGVYLLHYEDLPNFAHELGFAEVSA